MNNKIYKKEKGITLIALIITIIVLLLLAGISISMLSGQDGILSKAVEAKQASSEAEEMEEVKMAAAEATMNQYEKTLTKEEVVDQLGEDNFLDTEPYNNNIIQIKEYDGQKIPIPKGFTYLKENKVVDLYGNLYEWTTVEYERAYVVWNGYGFSLIKESTSRDDWQLCELCLGTSLYECEECIADEEAYEDCPDCRNIYGYYTCNTCVTGADWDEPGMINCTSSNAIPPFGEHLSVCSVCGMQSEETGISCYNETCSGVFEKKDCTICNNTGWVDCPDCIDGACNTCGARGEIPMEDITLRSECTNCNNTGNATCPLCWGTSKAYIP